MTEETTTEQTEEATGLALFNRTDEALAILGERLKDRVYDIATVKGMDEAKKDRAELRTLRVNLDKMRKQLNEDDQARIKARNTRAGEITAKIEALEDPIDIQIKAEETRKAEARAEREREEQQRLAAITAEISAIQRLPLTAIGSTADELQQIIGTLAALTLEQFDDVHLPTAQQAKDESLTVLNKMLAERRTLDEQAAELAERNRVAEAEAEERREAQAQEDAERAARQAEEDRQRAERDAADKAERGRIQAEQDARQAELDAQEATAAAERQQREQAEAQEREAAAQREREAQAEQDRQAEAERQAAAALAERRARIKLVVTMPDGSRWAVPGIVIAQSYADHYAATAGEAADPQRDVDSILSDANELTDWAANNMNWSDVVEHAEQVTPPAATDYQEGWLNGDKEVVGMEPQA